MLLIGNEWRDTGKHLAVCNPATDHELGRVAVAGVEVALPIVVAQRFARTLRPGA